MQQGFWQQGKESTHGEAMRAAARPAWLEQARAAALHKHPQVVVWAGLVSSQNDSASSPSLPPAGGSLGSSPPIQKKGRARRMSALKAWKMRLVLKVGVAGQPGAGAALVGCCPVSGTAADWPCM